MRIRWPLFVFCTSLLFCAGAVQGQLSLEVGVTPQEVVHRGGKITIAIAEPPAGVVYTRAVVRRLHEPSPVQDDRKITLVPVAPIAPQTLTTSYTGTITAVLLYGTYVLVKLETATEPEKNNIVPRDPKPSFRIDAATPPTIETVDPPVVYPNQENQYKLTVIGSNFSPNKYDNALLFDGRADLPMCDDVKPGEPCITAISASADGRQVVFGNIDRTFLTEGRFFGSRKVRVRVGTLRSDAEPIPAATFSMVNRRAPLQWAAWVTLGLLLVLVAVLAVARSNTPGRPYSLLAMALLDTESNTYSLSKAQFWVWTFVAVFGYAFLTLAKWLVQGQFEMPNVPENLPGIIFISAGTATFAMGMSGARPKGSGATKPSLGDFATTGGVVAPDRVQFLVWTIVGILAFLGLLTRVEPGTIDELPKIPEGFLYLMGIASAGYLGGKLARQPGPNVTGATAKAAQQGAPADYVIDITGRNLSVEAAIYLDQIYVQPQWLAANAAGAQLPEVVMYEDDRRYAKQLKYTIKNVTVPAGGTTITLPDGKTPNVKSILALVNPDGQRSERQM